MLVDPAHWQVDAYVNHEEVQRLSPGSAVRFYPEGQPTPIGGRVIAIGTTRVNQLEHPMLSSRFGGPLATVPHGEALIPSPALFHVLVQLDEAAPGLKETRGHCRSRRRGAACWPMA